MVIAPYKHHGMWVFDDPAGGLNKEPFIAGIDTMIDKMTASIPKAESGFRAVFSASPFPGHTEKLEWRRRNQVGPGTTATTTRWKAGSALRFSNTSPPHLGRSTCGRSRKADVPAY